MSARIDCKLARGTGDARVALVIESGDLVLATNGGAMRVDALGTMGAPECSLAAAADALRVSPAELRAAVVAAYPAADGWDWADKTDGLSVGDRVEGGDPYTEDYDQGTVMALREDGSVLVGWSGETQTWTSQYGLRLGWSERWSQDATEDTVGWRSPDGTVTCRTCARGSAPWGATRIEADTIGDDECRCRVCRQEVGR